MNFLSVIKNEQLEQAALLMSDSFITSPSSPRGSRNFTSVRHRQFETSDFTTGKLHHREFPFMCVLGAAREAIEPADFAVQQCTKIVAL